ncbi:hypothetical protein MBRA1_002717 [Malassezia brasiliensis]|uniref:Uncharacterized protein n=1 Tax=Malassezia brasiliensis TaxID=1821822 RepID=A0AAF0IQH1_9BASI|nr:hypothetical protein MBRA1_002717 [Malassezia brasiliensis]
MAERMATALRRGAHVVRLPPSALQPPNAAAHVRRRPAAQFRSELFTLQLYPLHLAVPDDATTMPRAFGPPWLPWPPKPETHHARHVRLADAARAALAGDPDRTRILRTTVFVSKKQVHKHAVVRNQCRTRLVATLRDVVRDPAVPVCDVFLYLFHANAALYACPRTDLDATLRRALAAVASACTPRAAAA